MEGEAEQRKEQAAPARGQRRRDQPNMIIVSYIPSLIST